MFTCSTSSLNNRISTEEKIARSSASLRCSRTQEPVFTPLMEIDSKKEDTGTSPLQRFFAVGSYDESKEDAQLELRSGLEIRRAMQEAKSWWASEA
ncbi:hypothetical protein EYF80_041142 [Liparis tanakae]|uniref:Uncharacterized protein n=1 Tax=Liparis tanakae TaxID=230148 RepID=A0A4Z2G554_9TELE|nr:hypothetical protein EYF80_041142 [Liparis tanakae]